MAASDGYLLEGARVLDPASGLDEAVDVLVEGGEVTVAPASVPDGARRVSLGDRWILPGLVDIQVHFRQPGFEHKETIASGAAAAFAGGVTSVVVMPNTKPTLDTPDAVARQLALGREAGLDLMVAAAVTVGLAGEELTDHAALKEAGAIAVTDDGLPVLDDDVMRASLEACAQNDLLFMQHAEDTTLTRHAPMTASEAQRALGVDGQPADAEGIMVERDVRLAGETGARYHVLHTSTARSLRAVREAKAAGHRVSCEASPHHLLLTTDACRDGDPNFKMNPPLREEADRHALVEALADGTVDALATDHAPHTADEKARGFVDAPFGVIGLETAFAALLRFVDDGTIELRRAVELMTTSPARVLGRSDLGVLRGARALCVVDPAREWEVTEDALAGRSKNSAFLGQRFKGRVIATLGAGRWRHDVDGLFSS
jgi:dihydroorotase